MQLARNSAPDDATPLLVVPDPDPALPAEAGPEEMFSAFYRKWLGPALEHAQRYLAPDDAEDAVAEVMCDLYLRWRRLRPDQRSETYLMGALYHIVLELLDAAKPFVSLEAADGALARRAMDATTRPSRFTTTDEVIDLAVREMPNKRREIFLLVREREFTYQQVASALQLKEGTVNNQMYKAMAQVRATFVREGFRIAGSDVDPARLPSITGGPTDG